MRANQALLALCLCMVAGTASAQVAGKALDINLTSDTVRAEFAWRLGNPNYRADVGWLYNRDLGDVVHASFHLVDAAAGPSTPLQAGLGLRLVVTRPDSGFADGGAVALGGFARYTLPKADRFNVGGYLYYAPNVTSFSDQREYLEVGARVGYNVLKDADIYVGVRRIEAKYDGFSGRFEFDSGFNAGFELRFK